MFFSEWFKEELRQLGGLDHLVRTMSDCLDFLTADEISMWTEPLHNKLKKVSPYDNWNVRNEPYIIH